jgi:ATP-binding cassette subfamily B multidrug efflux pump
MMHGGGGGRGSFDEDEILGKAYDARLMRRLLGYLRPYRGLVIVALAIILGISVTEAAPPVIAKFIVDNAIAPAVNGQIGTDEGLARLAPLGFAYIVVLLIGSGLRYAQTMLASYVGNKAMYDLRVQLFAHLQSLSLTFFDRNPVGRLMTRITNDIDALTDMVTQGVVAIFGDIVVIGTIAIVLLVLDFRGAPAPDLADDVLPPDHARLVPVDPDPPRAHQRVPEREPFGYGDRAALHA